MPAVDETHLDCVRQLASRHEILELKARYAAAADDKYLVSHRRAAPAAIEAAARRQAECFTREAVWSGGEFGGDICGRDALFRWFCRAPWRFAMHFYLAPILNIEGDRGAGRWRLLQIALGEEDGAAQLLGGVTIEEYRIEDDRWRIARMAFEQLHALRLDEVPATLRCLIPGPAR